jgi:hypothetical protein
MTTIVTRLYANNATAEKVAKALADKGFLDRDVDVIASPGAKPTAAQMRKVNDALRDAQVFPTAAKAYSERIKEGKSLVVVRPPFGATVAAQDIVDSVDSVNAGVKHQDTFVYPTSTSSVWRNRQLPSLLPGDARIMSGNVLPPLTSGRPIFSGLPQIIRKTGKAGLINKRIMGFMPLLWRYRQA